jgi:1,4-alpha-glucan branching enzyme
VIVAERGPLVFVFNFSPSEAYEGYKIGVPDGGKYRVALDSDDPAFGGQGRVGHDVDHFTSPEGEPGEQGIRIILCWPRLATVQLFRALLRQAGVQICW